MLDKVLEYEELAKKNGVPIVKDELIIPEWVYGELKERIHFDITVPKHELLYKERQYFIDEACFKYVLELMYDPYQIKTALNEIHGNKKDLEEARELALHGVERYYKICPVSQVPKDMINMGYIRVRYNNGVESTPYFNKKVMKNRDINASRLFNLLKIKIADMG